MEATRTPSLPHPRVPLAQVAQAAEALLAAAVHQAVVHLPQVAVPAALALAAQEKALAAQSQEAPISNSYTYYILGSPVQTSSLYKPYSRRFPYSARVFLFSPKEKLSTFSLRISFIFRTFAACDDYITQIKYSNKLKERTNDGEN